jgi:DNA-directed RNA polymerase subunit RPC12/RpoP
MAEVQETSSGIKKIHCSNCGAELRYKPGTTELVCDYCSTRNEINEQEIEIRERELEEFLRKEAESTGTEEVQQMECESCGAINPLEGTSVGKECLFCGGHLLVKDGARMEQIKPQALIPFQVDHREAVAKFKKWLHGLWFAPNDLKKMQNLPDRLKGIYIPFWTFDADTFTKYTGQRGIRRTETESYTVTVNGKTERRTRTKTRVDWYPASGQVSQFFDDELVLANDSLPGNITEQLHPWDLHKLVPFEPDYLRGFLVESYNINLEQGFAIGRDQIEDKIRQLVKRDIGGDEQRIFSMNTKWDKLTFKHVLLPIYVSAYRYKKKSYRFLINGQTGEVRGERPYSFWKIFFLVLGILIVLGIGYLLFGNQAT